jgi:phage-related tail protein
MAERQDSKTTTGSQGHGSAGAAAGTGRTSQAASSGATSASRPQGGAADPSTRGVSDMAGAAVEGARDMAGAAVENARGIAGQLVHDVRDVAESMLEEQKERAVEQVAGVAQALRKTAEDLRQENELIGRYAEQAAEQVERFAETVRQRSPGDLVADLDDFARRQPTLFLVGAVAAGFIVGRFMAASAERNRREYGRDHGRTGAPRHDTGPRDTRTRTAGYAASTGTRGNGHSRSATMGSA